MIELKPHVGQHLATRQEVDLGQDRIFHNGTVVGYVARKPDAPINLIYHDLPESVKEEIRQAVQAKFGGTAERVSEPIPLPEDDADDEFEEDE